MTDTSTILHNLGLEKLSAMQEAFVEACGSEANGRDLILLSPTGTGKTLAYLLGAYLKGEKLFGSLHDNEQTEAEWKGPKMVVVVPGRELAQQSEDVLKRMKCGLRSVCLIGGHATAEETKRMVAVRPHIVFATPGRLNDHLTRGTVKAENVKLFVIDEYDKCLDMGFADEMAAVRRQLPQKLRTWLVSATRSESDFARFVDTAKALTVDFATTAEQMRRTTHEVVLAPTKDKLETLARLLSLIGREEEGAPTIVFVSYRESVDRVYNFLKDLKFYVERYHGGMEQRDRERALYKFRCGGSNVLVATDLAARGLDIAEVRCVVHYHLPADETVMAHRNGRSTRWDNVGRVFTILGPEEHLPDFVSPDGNSLEEINVNDIAVCPMRPQWSTIYIGRGKKEKLSKGDIAGFLCKKGGLRGDDLGRIDVMPHCAYVAVKRDKIRGMLRAVAGEKIKGLKTIIEEMR